MHRYLVVAHKTLGGQHLLDEVEARLSQGTCHFHLLVPVNHPIDHLWTDGEVEAEAHRVLDAGIARFRQHGAAVSGEIGDANPVYAIDAVLRREPFDEIILSTLPPGPSRWLKLDVPSRVTREFRLPLTHLVAAPEPVPR